MKLPFALQKELGLEGSSQIGRPQRPRGSVRGRKEQRKAERQGKRHNARGSKPKRWVEVDLEESAGEELGEEDEVEDIPLSRRPNNTKAKATVKELVPKPKSILKKARQPSPPGSDTSSPSRSRSSSPGLVLDASSHAFKERAAQDDAEINSLERRLGLKKNKSPKSFADDGLDDLLEGLEGEERGVKRKSEEQQWLERKRRKAIPEEEVSSDGERFNIDDEDSEIDTDLLDDDGGESEDFSDGDLEDVDEEDFSEDDLDDGDGVSFEGFDSEEELPQAQPKRVRENPYIPPVSPNVPTGKYVPPSLRKTPNSDGPSLERLKRQVQGHLNKLSEANLVSILGEIEKIYQSNPRQDVTSVLLDLLLTPFYNRSALQNTFVILHAAFAAAVYKVIGVDFGAGLLSQLIDRFDQYHSDDATGKEALNLISLLANLFIFHVVSSAIVFDHIRLLLDRLSENNTELLLRLVRECGPQLRQDDPSSLKDIVQIMQKEVARMNSAGEQMSVRTKFMIETITDLKNNKMKAAATNNAGVSSDHITQMKKVLGSLNSRIVRASEPLRVTRDDIKNSDRKGKWWLVGASWKGNDPATATAEPTNGPTDSEQPLDSDSVDLLALARQYGMNTTVRRSIFIALLSALDYRDAHIRLLKLRLKRAQEHEIPKVLLRCAAGENPYNHYYTLVAKQLCLDKKMRKAFQFALWGWFRRLGENGDLEGDDENEDRDGEEDVEMSEIANMARLYAHLILEGAETLGVLKVLDLAYVKERTGMFVELLIVMIITEAQNSKANGKAGVLEKVFDRVAETPQVIKRLQFFIKKKVRKSDLADKRDRDTVKRGCKLALETLERLEMGGKAMEDGS